jgi:hypothetical protein
MFDKLSTIFQGNLKKIKKNIITSSRNNVTIYKCKNHHQKEKGYREIIIKIVLNIENLIFLFILCNNIVSLVTVGINLFKDLKYIDTMSNFLNIE